MINDELQHHRHGHGKIRAIAQPNCGSNAGTPV
jgi:hypothetical protein